MNDQLGAWQETQERVSITLILDGPLFSYFYKPSFKARDRAAEFFNYTVYGGRLTKWGMDDTSQYNMHTLFGIG